MRHRRKQGAAALVTAIVLALGLGTIACSETEDEEILACYYEVRSTSCSGWGFGDWEPRCLTFRSGDLLEDTTPADSCRAATRSDTECGGGCCLSFQYRNVEMVNGACSY